MLATVETLTKSIPDVKKAAIAAAAAAGLKCRHQYKSTAAFFSCHAPH
jgi:hypothetical protein